MLIGELAEKSGLPVDTIRFYEKKGLIGSALIRRRSNNYREYSDTSLERLLLIQQGKRLGFTLAEIQELIKDLESDQLTDTKKKSIILQKIEQIDERIEQLKTMRVYLSEKMERIGQ
ncbi:MerR family transcriptional regulator [Leptolyngbya sp. FACHB-36]|uniref:MerR family transcriptional regulator n=1 Tax=Leptolyngbya sp. FACHB-36 TaxID=2692808 RepID=UPI001680BDE2|nr:MerR family transcriptional regulator [Leptolyngbya sp. FACHB-36]MBD2020176.1 MerR family transcriptional regulator [Leptolyngbya sp. FACHB-36]